MVSQKTAFFITWIWRPKQKQPSALKVYKVLILLFWIRQGGVSEGDIGDIDLLKGYDMMKTDTYNSTLWKFLLLSLHRANLPVSWAIRQRRDFRVSHCKTGQRLDYESLVYKPENTVGRNHPTNRTQEDCAWHIRNTLQGRTLSLKRIYSERRPAIQQSVLLVDRAYVDLASIRCVNLWWEAFQTSAAITARLCRPRHLRSLFLTLFCVQ